MSLGVGTVPYTPQHLRACTACTLMGTGPRTFCAGAGPTRQGGCCGLGCCRELRFLGLQQRPQQAPQQAAGCEEVEDGGPAGSPYEGPAEDQPQRGAHVQAPEDRCHCPRALAPAQRELGLKHRVWDM